MQLRQLLSNPTDLTQLQRTEALRVAPGALAGTTITTAAIANLSSRQLCNTVFSSGLFFLAPHGEEPSRYDWDGTSCTAVNPDIEPVTLLVNYDPGIDVHVLNRLSDADAKGAHDHESIMSVPLSHITANSFTKIYLSKRTVETPKGVYRVRFSKERYLAKAEVYPRLHWRESGKNFFHISIAFSSYTVEHYSTRPSYTVPMILEQVRCVRWRSATATGYGPMRYPEWVPRLAKADWRWHLVVCHDRGTRIQCPATIGTGAQRGRLVCSTGREAEEDGRRDTPGGMNITCSFHAAGAGCSEECIIRGRWVRSCLGLVDGPAGMEA